MVTSQAVRILGTKLDYSPTEKEKEDQEDRATKKNK